MLALTPPRVAPRPELPAEAAPIHLGRDGESGNDNGILREALRLRVRWMQELSGRAAWELGVRLTASGDLVEPDMIRHMTLEHVEAVFTKRAVVVPSLVQTHLHDFGAPLPAWFQLSDLGKVDPGADATARSAAAPAPAAGRDAGRHLRHRRPAVGLGARHDDADARARPACSPDSTGIVAETGSVLSHLAILAREAGVPTVVGYANAVQDLPEGAEVHRRRRDRPGHAGDRGGVRMKTIAWLAGIGTLLAGAVYMVVSLNRWEWNRALFFGLIVLIAEVGLATGLVLRKLDRLERRIARSTPRRSPCSATPGPPSPDRFAWLKESTHGQINVFITFLVGGGVILSGSGVGGRPAGVEDLDSRSARSASPPSSTRSATRAVGWSSTTSPCSPRTCPGADDAQIRKLLRRAGRP